MSLLLRRRMLLSRKKKSRNILNMYNHANSSNITDLDNGYLRITAPGAYYDIFAGMSGTSDASINDRCPYLQSGTYTISWVTSANFFVKLVSDETRNIVINRINWSSGYQSYTFTITEPCYLKCGRAANNSGTSYTDIGEIMLNEGSEALPYEPYEE